MENFRFEGLSLTVQNVQRSLDFYVNLLGLQLAYNAAPDFALVKCTGGGSIGLLSSEVAQKDGVAAAQPAQLKGIHVEFSTDNLDALFEALKAKGVTFHTPPHDEPWERSMTALDPDGHCVEFAQGRRGTTLQAR